MTFIFVLFFASSVTPAMDAFEAAAKSCKMETHSARYPSTEGKYDPKSRTVLLLENQSRNSLDCMREWAKRNGLNIVIARN